MELISITSENFGLLQWIAWWTGWWSRHRPMPALMRQHQVLRIQHRSRCMTMW